MEYMTQAQQLAVALSEQFGFDEMHLTVQMRRGEDWISLDMYRNSDEPHRLHAKMDFQTGADFLRDAMKSH